MTENVAVKHEGAYVVPAEIDTKLDIGKRMRGISVPAGNFDHIEILAGDAGCGPNAIDGEIVLRFDEEVQLVKVKFVIFFGVILDGPLLDSALSSDDVGTSVGIEDVLRFSEDVHEKGSGLNLVEEDGSLDGDRRSSKSGKALVAGA